MHEDQRDILAQAASWRRAGRGVAIATVVSTWGSAPRPVGSLLAVCDDRQFIGSVSGGCIEGAVIDEAMQVLANRTCKVLDFGVTNELAWEMGLACGGRIEIFVEPVE